MSCILYPRVNYLALAGDLGFQDLCDAAEVDIRGIGEIMFQINIDAFTARYGSSISTPGSFMEDVQVAREFDRIDYEFMEYLLQNHTPKGLLKLLQRIDYQYAEDEIENNQNYKCKFKPILNKAELADVVQKRW